MWWEILELLDLVQTNKTMFCKEFQNCYLLKTTKDTFCEEVFELNYYLKTIILKGKI